MHKEKYQYCCNVIVWHNSRLGDLWRCVSALEKFVRATPRISGSAIIINNNVFRKQIRQQAIAPKPHQCINQMIQDNSKKNKRLFMKQCLIN